MNKYIKVLAVSLALIPIISFASIEYNLKYGQKNPEVRELQDFLIDKGVLADGNNTGYFGLKTLKAVKQYQADNRIPNTGYVGNLTRGAINAELETLTASSTEQEVAETGTSTLATSTPVVNSQPSITYIYNYPTTPESIIQTTNAPMEITISEPTATLTNQPNTGKYTISFTVSDNKKALLFTYNGTSTSGEYSKGGISWDADKYKAGEPTTFVTDYEGTLNYKIDYGNGLATREGTINIE